MSAERLPLGKACSKCGETKPLEEFHRDSRRRDGKRVWCKSCMAHYMKRYCEENKEARTEYAKRYYAKNRERRLEQQKRYHEKNRHNKEYGEKCRQGWIHYRKKNREKRVLYNRRYREENREKELESRRRWRKENPEKERVMYQRRRARKLNASGNYTDAEWQELCRVYGKICLCCGEEKPLTVDHVIPLSRGGLNDISNIQPLCRSCNSSKHTKTIDYRISREKLGEAS